MILGPALPDSLAPAVEFEQPLDGMEFELRSAVPVRALADDDGAIERLVLYKDGEPEGGRRAFELRRQKYGF